MYILTDAAANDHVGKQAKSAGLTTLTTFLLYLPVTIIFDTVNHNILLSTISEPGLSGTELLWFESLKSLKVSLHHWGTTRICVWSPTLLSYSSQYMVLPLVCIFTHMFFATYADDTQLYLTFLADSWQRAQQNLKIVQNAAACLVLINKPKTAHITLLFITFLKSLLFTYGLVTDRKPASWIPPPWRLTSSVVHAHLIYFLLLSLYLLTLF